MKPLYIAQCSAVIFLGQAGEFSSLIHWKVARANNSTVKGGMFEEVHIKGQKYCQNYFNLKLINLNRKKCCRGYQE